MPPEPVLILGLSGRALAASARRAGYAPIVLDAFCDVDTQACALASERVPIAETWSFDGEWLLAAAQRLAPPPMPLVWCSGFERATGLLDEVARGRTLYGNDAATTARIKDPFGFAARLAELGIAHPEVHRELPEDPAEWLIKRIGGAGGAHIRPATRGAPAHEDEYYQRHVPGTPISAMIMGDGARARVLNFSEQWADPAPDGQTFRFSGCAVPAVLPASGLLSRLARAAETVASSYALRGVGSVDFMIDRDRFHLLEVNPRPGASFDACERAYGVSLFEAHVRACRGELEESLPAPRRAAASAIVYARSELVVPHGMEWPDWAADRGPDGTVIFPGDPVCTVFGEAADPSEARRQTLERADKILAHLARATAACQPAWAMAGEALADAHP